MNLHPPRLVTLLLMACIELGCEPQVPSPSRRAARLADPPGEATMSGEEATSHGPVSASAGGTPGGSAAGTRSLGENRERMEQLLARVARETEEARNAAGETHCDRAWSGVQTLANAFASKGGGARRGNLPDREEFLRLCRSLPEDAQRCMTIAYSLSHQRECAAAREALAPEQRGELDGLFPSGG